VAVVAAHPGCPRYRRLGAGRFRRAVRHPDIPGAALCGRDGARVRDLGRGGGRGGSLASPLPQVLGIGTLVLSVPWWANRRRRAKVRVARTIATWPDIARAVGLVGSEIMSATVDLW